MIVNRKKAILLNIVFIAVALSAAFASADNPPVVTLNLPLNDTTSDAPASVIFNFSVTDDNSVINCSLWGNFSGIWALNQTISSTSNVYQETADASDVGIAVKAIDGNWSSYEARDNFAYYMNYTKLSGSIGALWTISGGIAVDHNPTNYTVPSACWNYLANKLVFRAITNENLTGNSHWYCYDGSSWIAMKSFNGGRGFWEEAVWWVFASVPTSTILDFNQIALDSGSYIWNVQCYDNAGQPDFEDSNWTINIVTPTSPTPTGGGNPVEVLHPLPPLPPEVVVPSIEPLVGNELTSEQVSEIQSITHLNYASHVSEEIFGSGSLSLLLTNTGHKIIKNISFAIEEPAKEKPIVLHPNRIFGWENSGLTGWATADYVKEPELLDWEISNTKSYAVLKPGDSITIDFDIKTPLTTEESAELKLDVFSYGSKLYSQDVPVKIEPTEFLVVGDVHPKERLADIYMVVANQKDEEDMHYIELNFDKGTKTVGADIYGPYKIDAKDTMLFAYQYKYLDEFADDYTLRYVLYDKEGKVKEAAGSINLKG